jgi:hypothetical protein
MPLQGLINEPLSYLLPIHLGNLSSSKHKTQQEGVKKIRSRSKKIKQFGQGACVKDSDKTSKQKGGKKTSKRKSKVLKKTKKPKSKPKKKNKTKKRK